MYVCTTIVLTHEFINMQRSENANESSNNEPESQRYRSRSLFYNPVPSPLEQLKQLSKILIRHDEKGKDNKNNKYYGAWSK
jgi:hypothetical protein